MFYGAAQAAFTQFPVQTLAVLTATRTTFSSTAWSIKWYCTRETTSISSPVVTPADLANCCGFNRNLASPRGESIGRRVLVGLPCGFARMCLGRVASLAMGRVGHALRLHAMRCGVGSLTAVSGRIGD